LRASNFRPYRATFDLTALSALLDETIAIKVAIDGAARLGLDGSDRFNIFEISVVRAGDENPSQIEMIVWGGPIEGAEKV
jgi:hypothetical protein